MFHPTRKLNRSALASAGAIVAISGALCAVPVATAATPGSSGASASSTPCAVAGGFAQVQVGQTLAQVQQEMGSAGNTSDTTTQSGFVREEVTWRNCSTLAGNAGLLDDGVVFNATPNQPLLVSSKSQLALGD